METILETKDLCKTYGEGDIAVKAVKSANIGIKKGSFVAIVGESGSGKTSLLNMLGGLDDPTSGSVLIQGKDIYSMPEEKRTLFRRRKIGFIFQAFNLIPELTVEQNIIFPLLLDGKKIDRGYLEDILKILKLDERRNHLPSKLSGGQRQRVAIGRALITKPAIILADEPTGNLDSKNTKEVINLLKTAASNYQQTIIMITHSNAIARSADEIYNVQDGVISKVG